MYRKHTWLVTYFSPHKLYSNVSYKKSPHQHTLQLTLVKGYQRCEVKWSESSIELVHSYIEVCCSRWHFITMPSKLLQVKLSLRYTTSKPLCIGVDAVTNYAKLLHSNGGCRNGTIGWVTGLYIVNTHTSTQLLMYMYTYTWHICTP